MPIYEYRCRSCGNTRESTSRDAATQCTLCGGNSARDYGSVLLGSSFVPHFNHAVGAHVSNERDFKAKLNQRADENSARTGTDHKYEMIYPGDRPPTAGTDILETRDRIVHDKQLTPRDLGVDV